MRALSHRFYDGTIYHKRFHPKKHEFKYKFFFLDINLNFLEELKNRLFSINSFNLFSFSSKSHFGESKNFNANVKELLEKFEIKNSENMRFVTLPAIFGFVFNPISLLLLFEDDKPKYMLAEVHNYNGGRVIYPITLKSKDGKTFKGESQKDMYVSPFFQRDGDYKFTIVYEEKRFLLSILLFENNIKMLSSTFEGKNIDFSEKNILKLFFKHTLLTTWVVTRTLWQSLKLKLKGLSWNSPIQKDTKRRF